MHNQFLQDLTSDTPKIKYACTNKCLELSQKNPAQLYPDLQCFVDLLDSENHILQWIGLRVIGNLSAVDNKDSIDPLLPKLISFLNTGKMITASNAALGLVEIARHKPKYQKQIIHELLQVEQYTYDTSECRNVCIGNVIKALSTIKDNLKDNQEVKDFLSRQTHNTRHSVQKKSAVLLEQLSKVS